MARRGNRESKVMIVGTVREIKNHEYRVGSGDIGPVTRKLRGDLVAIQQGTAPDRFGWLTAV